MNKRIVTFPTDWIKPGEFTYCGRCGRPETCTLGDSLLNNCPLCAITTILFKVRHPNDPTPNPIMMAELKGRCQAMTEIAKTNNEFRNTLANIRKGHGLPPLFWMAENYDKESGWNANSLKQWKKAMSK